MRARIGEYNCRTGAGVASTVGQPSPVQGFSNKVSES